jgi:hypothetical protein
MGFLGTYVESQWGLTNFTVAAELKLLFQGAGNFNNHTIFNSITPYQLEVVSPDFKVILTIAVSTFKR